MLLTLYPSITGSSLSLTGQSFCGNVCSADIIPYITGSISELDPNMSRVHMQDEGEGTQTTFPKFKLAASLHMYGLCSMERTFAWRCGIGWKGAGGVLSRTDSRPIICSMNRKACLVYHAVGSQTAGCSFPCCSVCCTKGTVLQRHSTNYRPWRRKR